MDLDTFDPNNPYFCYGVDTICRVCHKILDNSTNIYSVDTRIILVGKESIEAYKVLESISKFKLGADGSQFLCFLCYNHTESTYKFQQTCNEAQMLLDNYLIHQQLLMETGDGDIEEKIDIGETVIQMPMASVDDEGIEIKAERGSDEEKEEEPHCVPQTNEGTVTKETETILKLNNYEDNADEFTDDKEDNLLLKEILKGMRKKGVEKCTTKQRVRREWKNKEGKYQCKFCMKEFVYKCYLTPHERSHTGERPYQCKFCKSAFVTNSNLRQHMKTHTDDRPYQCKVCKNAYTCNFNLINHMKVHTRSCEMSFTWKTQLDRHENIHTRLFQCKICKKSFKCKWSIKHHLRIHTGERPYQCNFCEKAFTWKSALMVHERLHTGERPYECKTCKRRFVTKQYLTRHEISHAKIWV